MIPYQIRTFRGGVSDEADKGISGSFKHGHALDIHKRDDSLSCGQAMVTVLDETRGMGVYSGTTITAPFNFFVPASDGSTYAFGDTGSIFCRSGEGSWLFVYNDENGRINGATEWETNDGANFIYWATSSMISRKPLPGDNSAPDTGTMRWTDVTNEYKVEFISSAATWHTMAPLAGALYIANDENLAQLSFANAFNPAAMNVRPQNSITSLEERNDYVVLGSERRDETEEGHIWNWVETAANYVQKKKIPVKGINALIYTEVPILQGGNQGELFFSDFNNAVPLNSVPGGGRVNPGGVDIFDDRAMFGFYGSSISYPGIWSYGRKRKNRPFALNYEYRLSGTVNGSTISTIGAIKVAESNLLASWGTTDGSTSEYGIDQVSTTTKATGLYEGLEFDAKASHLEKKFDTVKVITAPLPASTSISIKFKLNKDVSWKYAVLGDRTTTFTQTDATVAIFMINRTAEVYEVGAELNPSGNTTPEILSITTYMANEKGEF